MTHRSPQDKSSDKSEHSKRPTCLTESGQRLAEVGDEPDEVVEGNQVVTIMVEIVIVVGIAWLRTE